MIGHISKCYLKIYNFQDLPGTDYLHLTEGRKRNPRSSLEIGFLNVDSGSTQKIDAVKDHFKNFHLDIIATSEERPKWHVELVQRKK